MAYVSQDLKKKLAPAIKAVLKKYGLKGSVAVNHYSTLVVNIKSGVLDLIGDVNKASQREVVGYHQVNVYHAESWASDPKIKALYKELIAAMKGDSWFDKSDIMTDYFHTAYYLSINVGKWDKPYELTVA